MKRHYFDDPMRMPGSGLSPGELFEGADVLAGSAGQAYVERRGISVAVAEAAGVRFISDFGGRPAVVVALRDHLNALTSVHGRYLETVRGQNKMLTVGPGNGMISLLDGWRAKPLIVVEGLFDALSLASCGWSAVAHIGRWAAWLPEVAAQREVWLAFDASKAAQADALRYTALLPTAKLRRVLPPPRCKDWNTALVKRGRGEVRRWLQRQLTHGCVGVEVNDA